MLLISLRKYAKHAAPTNIVPMPISLSLVEVQDISPYPTLASVAIEK
jgi:hypothetical protein